MPRTSARLKAAIDLTLSDSDGQESSSDLELVDHAPPPSKRVKRASTTTTTSGSGSKAQRKGKEKAQQDLEVIDLEDDDEEEEVGALRPNASGAGEMDADEAFARQLQAEEDEAVVVEDQGVGGSRQQASPVPSTSSGRRVSARTRDTKTQASGTTYGESNDPQDPKTLLYKYRKLLNGSAKCKCGGKLKVPKLPDLGSDNAEEEFLATGAADCSSCSKLSCRGCGEPATSAGKCCSESRLIVLFSILAALDNAYLTERLHKPVATTETRPKAKKARGKPKGTGAGVGYGSGSSYAYTPGYGQGANFAALAMGGVGIGGGVGYGGAYDEEEGMYPSDYESEDEEGYYAHAALLQQQQHKKALANAADPPPAHVNQADLDSDKLFASSLELLTPLMPRPDHVEASIYDYLPHEAFAPLLNLSTLPDLLSQLLRNDSVEDWQKRKAVYFALLKVIEALGGSEATLPILYGERWDKKWSEGLEKWVKGEGDVAWERKEVKKSPVKKGGRKRKSDVLEEEVLGEPIKAVSLFTQLKKMVTQAEAFRKAAVSGDLGDTDAALISLCGDLSTAGERAKTTLGLWLDMQARNGVDSNGRAEEIETPGSKGKGKGKGKDKAVEQEPYTDADYAKVCSELAYETLELSTDNANNAGKSFFTHYYNSQITAIASSQRPQRGFTHIARELAVLSTSLPPGVWLRVDEARIDVIKALIAGPEGTPYVGGLFEFDIHLPLTYPQVAPLVWLKTTANNTVRFNPNLYAEGKTCLSLIGTWPGRPEEQWNAHTSTLLQVFVSIQSMILCDRPYFNEPGYGAPKDSKPSKDYNANVQLATARWAINDWMSESKKNSIWSDVVVSHFTLRQDIIRSALLSSSDARLRAWLPSHNQLAGTSQTVALAGYGAGAAAYMNPALLAGKSYNAMVKAQQQAAQAAASVKSMDLVMEFEEGLKRIKEWKEESFVKKLLA